MEPGTCYTSTLISLVVPVILALWFGEYLVDTFFPDVTLIGLGAFYGMGVGIRSGDTGISWGFSSTTEGEG